MASSEVYGLYVSTLSSAISLCFLSTALSEEIYSEVLFLNVVQINLDLK